MTTDIASTGGAGQKGKSENTKEYGVKWKINVAHTARGIGGMLLL